MMPYAGGEKWAHPAGHLLDKTVPCAAGTNFSYSLDRDRAVMLSIVYLFAQPIVQLDE